MLGFGAAVGMAPKRRNGDEQTPADEIAAKAVNAVFLDKVKAALQQIKDHEVFRDLDGTNALFFFSRR